MINEGGALKWNSNKGLYGRAFDATAGGTIDLSSGGTAWFSVIARFDDGIDGAGTRHLFFCGDGSSNNGFGVEYSSSGQISARITGNFGATSTNAIVVGDGTNPGETALIVGRITYGGTTAGETTTVDLWLNPSDFSTTAALGTPDATNSVDGADLGDHNFGNNTDTYLRYPIGGFLDEIRLGITLDDVTPIPFSIDPIPNQGNVSGDAGEISVPFSNSIGYGATQILSASATSSDETIIAAPTVTMNAEQTGGEITFTPTNTDYGTVTITLTLQDDGGTANGRVDTKTESFDITITDPALPQFGVISDKSIFVNSGVNTVLIPGLNGGSNASTDISITATSSDNSIVEVTGTDYNSNNTFAELNIQEKGVQGTATITITVSDADGSVESTFDVTVVPYTTHGFNFTIHDVAFWQEYNVLNSPYVVKEIWNKAEVPLKDEYNWDDVVMQTSTLGDPDDNRTYTFGTAMVKGYIQAPETGNYIFSSTTPGGDHVLFLSSDATYENAEIITAKADSKFSNVGTQVDKTTLSDYIHLEAGEIYAFYGMTYYVFSPGLTIEWETPSGTKEIIPAANGYYLYDTEKPTAPQALNLESYSSSKIIFNWSQSTDNETLAGYNLYVNGELWNAELLQDTSLILEDLDPDTRYSLTVTAQDEAGNESSLSDVLNVTTYPEDNTPPNAPENITAVTTAPMALEIAWDKAVDETGIYGYNVYVDGVLFNTDAVVLDNSLVISVLDPETSYDIEVEAIDAGENVTKSAPVPFTTSVFDPLAENLGVKTGRLSIDLESIGAFDGFGMNQSDVSGQITRDLLKELNPTLLRWGTITVNYWGFDEYSGTSTYTIADFFSFAVDTLEAQVSFTFGVNEETDWIKDPNTFLTFMEYIGGDETTTGGAIRIAEGYTEPFLPRLKYLMLEFGNETWGKTDHGVTPELDSEAKYAQWAMEMEDLIKTSPYYQENADKIDFVYSGRNAERERSFGVNERIYAEADTAHLDVMGISGYLHDNVGDGGEINTTGDAYFRNLTECVHAKVEGLRDYHLVEQINNTGEVKKIYFYEGDASRQDYNGRLGQAVSYFDMGLATIPYGSVYPALFALTGGQWAMVSVPEDYKRLPKFIGGNFINNFARGQLLRSHYETDDIIYDHEDKVVDLDPVGHSVFANDTIYSIVLLSRDYENDQYVQIDIPDGFTFEASTLGSYQFTGDAAPSRDSRVDTLEMNMLEDGMLVKVPKYSIVALQFKGEDLGFDKPLGYVDYVKQEGVTLSAPSTEFTSDMSSLLVEADITPEDALGENVYWSVSSEDDVNVEFIDYGSSMRIRSTDKEGTFTVRGTSLDDPAIYDELEFTSVITSINDIADEDLEIFPNPVSDVLNIKSKDGTIDQVNVFNMQGNLVLSATVTGNEEQINMSGLKEGSYIIELKGENKNARFIVIKK